MENNNDNQNQDFLEAARLDTAGKSLADALRISFTVLKVIMVVLVVLFLTSGIFRVQEDENALVLRFGKIRGNISEDRVLGPGLNWAWPEPISEIITIPVTKVQALAINSLWYFETDAEKLGRPGRAQTTLNPAIDGYCLTRNDSMAGGGDSDYNIVHSKWELKYRISRPERFFRNIYYNATAPGQDFLDVAADTVNPLLESLASNAIAVTMVNYSIDDAIVSKTEIASNVKRLLQEKLDKIGAGITVEAMHVSGKITWPRQVDDAFQRLINASQESDTKIISAKREATRILNETGGANAEQVLEELKKGELDAAGKEKLLSRLAGSCQEKISRARSDRTKVVETAKANAEYLAKLLPQYHKRPELVLQDIYQEAIREVMDNADEKIFVQPSAEGKSKEFRVIINRKPVKKK
jgi:modulator of FtsH protease HflK